MGFKRLTNWMTSPEKAGVRSKIIDRLLLVAGVALVSSAYGYMAAQRQWFPYGLIQQAKAGRDKVEEMLGIKYPWYYMKVGDQPLVRFFQPGRMAPGLTLVNGLGPNNYPFARVIDANGKVLHSWELNWFELYPRDKHLPDGRTYDSLPGPNSQGMLIQQNGDLIVNFEAGGLMRLDACGHVKWLLNHVTHHSLEQDDDGNLWVPDLVMIDKPDPTLPGYAPPIYDNRLLKVSPDTGKILQEWRLFDLFRVNGLRSAAYMTSKDSDMSMGGDTTHMNDMDVFPRTMTPGTFKPGDVMVSVRNINMIFVFDPKTNKIVHIFQNDFIHQHDPNFIDGNTIRVFDNNAQTRGTAQQSSRIVELYTDGRPARVIFEGTKEHPFFSNIMGKQQTLPNGNLLLTEGTQGRTLEIDAQGKPVWEYRNFYRKGMTGLMDISHRLDPSMDAAFFAAARARCKI